MRDKIIHSVQTSIQAVEKLLEEKALIFIEKVAHMIADAFNTNNKIIIAGNGGSLCDSIHFAEELTGFFRQERKALPAIALSDVGLLSCIGNDMGYEYVFSRGVEAYGQKDDVFIALTTSGNSLNLINAVDAAKKRELKTISFLGKDGGKLKDQSDLEWIVDGFKTSDRIQEAHMAAIHIIIEMIEEIIFVDKGKETIEKILHQKACL